MGSPSGLVLECRPSTLSSATLSLADASPPLQLHRLEEYLHALEEERQKIEAFKRELPLCMQLLHNAIEAYKQELVACKPLSQSWPHFHASLSFNDTDSNLQSPSNRVVIEDFIPLKKPIGSSLTDNCEDELPHKKICKPNWMKASECSNFQAEANNCIQERCLTNLTMERACPQSMQEQAFSTSSKPFFHSKNKSGGAFMPFSRDKQVVQPTARPGALNPSDLALTRRDHEGSLVRVSETTGFSSKLVKAKPKEIGQQQSKELAVKESVEVANGSNDSLPARKARRCWSPELHRRFVSALQQLGGSQVATPKQIRELMKVEGLTNDEVKSHLQKYRLHTRRPGSTQVTSTHTPQVVVLGGIWVPPEYTVHTAAQQTSTLYNTSRQQPDLCQTTSSQELYSEVGSLDQIHLHPLCCEQKFAPAHSQSSLQELVSHSAVVFHPSDDNGREESIGDDGNSSCKGSQQGRQLHNEAEVEDDKSREDSINNGSQSHCTSEDGYSRGGETNGIM